MKLVSVPLSEVIVDESPPKAAIAWRWASPSLVFCYLQQAAWELQRSGHTSILFIHIDAPASNKPSQAKSYTWSVPASSLVPANPTAFDNPESPASVALRHRCAFNPIIIMGDLPRPRVLSPPMEALLRNLIRAGAKPKSVHVLDENLSVVAAPSSRYHPAIQALTTTTLRKERHVPPPQENQPLSLLDQGGLLEVIPPPSTQTTRETRCTHGIKGFALFVGRQLPTHTDLASLPSTLGIQTVIGLLLSPPAGDTPTTGLTSSPGKKKPAAAYLAITSPRVTEAVTVATASSTVLVDTCFRASSLIFETGRAIAICDGYGGTLAAIACIWFLVEASNPVDVAIQHVQRKFVGHLEIPPRFRQAVSDYAQLLSRSQAAGEKEPYQTARLDVLDHVIRRDTEEQEQQQQQLLQPEIRAGAVTTEDEVVPMPKVQAAVHRMRQQLTAEEVVEACKVMRKMAEKVLLHPTDAHYRSVKLVNPKFSAAVGKRQAAVAVLETCGWQKNETSIDLPLREPLAKMHQLLTALS